MADRLALILGSDNFGFDNLKTVIRVQRFQPSIVDSRCFCLGDPLLNPLLEFAKYQILNVDR